MRQAPFGHPGVYQTPSFATIFQAHFEALIFVLGGDAAEQIDAPETGRIVMGVRGRPMYPQTDLPPQVTPPLAELFGVASQLREIGIPQPCPRIPNAEHPEERTQDTLHYGPHTHRCFYRKSRAPLLDACHKFPLPPNALAEMLGRRSAPRMVIRGYRSRSA